MVPKLISGESYKDDRGQLNYNNSIDLSQIRRFYTIVNYDTSFNRGWQGHRVEQRWFTAVSGSFKIQLILIDNWNEPSNILNKRTFKIDNETLDVLYIPPGYVSSISSLKDNSKLLVMSDYKLN